MPHAKLRSAREDNRYPFSKAPFNIKASTLQSESDPDLEKIDEKTEDVQPTSPHPHSARQPTPPPQNLSWLPYGGSYSLPTMPNFAKLRGWKIPRKNYSDVLTAPSEIPGLDLMLAISMTTAFASLTDNTDVLTGD
ncbi:hypothetical protein SISNIDRAFT_301672 [Sistotremastrum niveocremeum HHB9708]|uniref:Uncharacterized protein n=1 Tax=Sistotremastrum niveocremeum HHB9708 TaxID=1314777 RepID=A0A164N885_9AGAM|nr:hypothetical protein SISNIDRAFT_301672 [Sistotremastrum niveocremeum HHB9708]